MTSLRKHLLSAVALSLLLFPACAPAFTLVDAACLGGSAGDYGSRIRAVPSGEAGGGSVIVGATRSANGDVSGNHGGHDIWVVRRDDSGAILWSRCYGGSGSDTGADVQTAASGGFIVAGTTNSVDGDITGKHGNDDIWVARLNADGDILWSACLGGSASDQGVAVRETADGGVLVFGVTRSPNGTVSGHRGEDDIFVCKLDAEGAILWSRCYGGGGFDLLSGVTAYPEGGAQLLVGSTNSTDGDVSGLHEGGAQQTDGWLTAISETNGSILWSRCCGGTERDAFASARADGNGFIVTGVTNSNDGDVSGVHAPGAVTFSDAWVLRISGSGDILASRCIGGSGDDYGAAIVNAETGWVLLGGTGSEDGDLAGTGGRNERDIFLAEIASEDFEPTLVRCFGGNAMDAPVSLQPVAGGCLVLGTTASTNGSMADNHGLWDLWAARVGREDTGSGGGCDAGAGFAAVLAALPALLVFRRKKRSGPGAALAAAILLTALAPLPAWAMGTVNFRAMLMHRDLHDDRIIVNVTNMSSKPVTVLPLDYSQDNLAVLPAGADGSHTLNDPTQTWTLHPAQQNDAESLQSVQYEIRWLHTTHGEIAMIPINMPGYASDKKQYGLYTYVGNNASLIDRIKFIWEVFNVVNDYRKILVDVAEAAEGDEEALAKIPKTLRHMIKNIKEAVNTENKIQNKKDQNYVSAFFVGPGDFIPVVTYPQFPPTYPNGANDVMYQELGKDFVVCTHFLNRQNYGYSSDDYNELMVFIYDYDDFKKAVTPAPVKGISFDTPKIMLPKGLTANLFSSLRFDPDNATNKKVSWTSSDPTNFPVDRDGVVTFKGQPGAGAVIRARSDDGGHEANVMVSTLIPR